MKMLLKKENLILGAQICLIGIAIFGTIYLSEYLVKITPKRFSVEHLNSLGFHLK